MKFFHANVYFIAHLYSDATFSLEILDPDLDFTNRTVEKVQSPTQVVPNALQTFSMIELSISF